MYTSDTIMDIKYSGINYKNKIMCILFLSWKEINTKYNIIFWSLNHEVHYWFKIFGVKNGIYTHFPLHFL
jgi:hypothetical protein